MADQNNPWDTTPAADSAAQSADAWGTPATAPTDGGGADWLTSTPAPNVEHFNILDPFHKTLIPLDSWVTEGIDWVVTHGYSGAGGNRPAVLYRHRFAVGDLAGEKSTSGENYSSTA